MSFLTTRTSLARGEVDVVNGASNALGAGWSIGGLQQIAQPDPSGPALITEEAKAAIPLAGLQGADPLPPYVRLIHDVIIGDRSLFTRPDGLAAVWEVANPLLTNPPEVIPYPQGSWGPEQAQALIAPDHWLLGQ